MTTFPKASILVLLVIGFCYAADYQEIPANKQAQYPLIPTLRKYGTDIVLNNALKAGKIQNTQFSVSSTNHIYLKTSGTYSYYKFDLSLKNAKGDQLNTVFEARYDSKTKKQLLTSSSYAVKYASTNGTGTNPPPTGNGTNPTPPGGYQLIPSSEYNSTLIQSLADFGKNYTVSQAVSKAKLPAGTYAVTLINSVMKQVLQSVANYRFDVQFEKSDGTREVEATYDIAYNASSGNMTVIAHNYTVLPYGTNPPTTPVNNTNPPPTGNGTNPTPPTGNGTNPTPPGGYQPIPSSEYNSTLIQSLANFGKNYIVNSAVSKGKLPSGTYSVTVIQSVAKQVLQKVTNYRFDVVFEKSDGSREVEANYDIAYTLSSGKMSVIAHNYQVLPYTL